MRLPPGRFGWREVNKYNRAHKSSYSLKELVCKVTRSLYGSKQASREANKVLVDVLVKIGFKQCISDDKVFVLRCKNSIMYFSVHIDDILSVWNDEHMCSYVYNEMKKVFSISVTKEPQVYLALQIVRNRKQRKMIIHQESYIEKVLVRFGMEESNIVPTPITSVEGLQHPRDVKYDDHNFDYAGACGAIIWLLNTHPEISFSVSVLTRYIMNNDSTHVKMMKRLIRFLKGVKSCGIVFKSETHKQFKYGEEVNMLTVCTDSDLAGRVYDSKSTIGVSVFLGEDLEYNCIDFKSQVERKVATSTTQAECYAVMSGVKSVLYYISMLEELGLKQTKPVKVYNDNDSLIKLCRNPIMHNLTRHYRIALHFIRQLVEDNILEIIYIPSNENVADLFTKPLSKLFFRTHMDKYVE